MKRTTTRIPPALLVVPVALVLAACGGGGRAGSSHPSGPTPPPSATASPVPPPPTGDADLAKFNAIQSGMTLPQLEQIMGSQGSHIVSNSTSTSSNLGTTSVTIDVYRWAGTRPSSAITVTLQNGSVVNKSQVGLE